jgi:hypothetical protein
MGDLVARTPRLTAAAILASLLTVDGAGSGLDADKVDGREPGSASGLATLDSGGKVPLSQLPDTVVGAVEYQGSWNASTNSPNLGGLSPSKGDYYVVSTGGTTSLGGISDWGAGDWAIYNGTAWQKVDNTDAVSSVAGRTGAVVLAAADIASGTFAVARGGTGISTIASGAMLYASALDTVAALAIGTSGQVLSSSGTAPQWSSSIDVTSTIRTKGAATAGIQLDRNAATGDFTLSLSPANLTANRRWSFPDADTTAAGLAVAQTFSAAQTMSSTLTLSAGTGQSLVVSSTTDSTTGTSGCAKFGGGISLNGNIVSAAASSRLAIGGSGYLSRVGIYCSPTFTDSATAIYGMIFEATLSNSNTAFKGLNISGVGVASGKTLSAYYGVYVADTYGAGSTTDSYGIYVDPITVASGQKFAIYTNAGTVRIGDTTDSSSTTTGGFQALGGGAFAKSLTVGGTSGNFINIANPSGALKINSTQVVGARRTGWSAWTGTATRTAIATSTATATQCADAIKALVDDLITHGLIGA